MRLKSFVLLKSERRIGFMKKKTALTFASLLMVLLASFAFVPPASSAPVTLRYVQMTGNQTSHAEQGGSVTVTNSTSTPDQSSWNITFGDPRQTTGTGKWVVDLTIPNETRGAGGASYEYSDLIGWIKIESVYLIDEPGWLFLNATGDVDCYVSNNSTGVYWISPSPLAGTKACNLGELPSPGADGVPGTGDDGFGDGTPDPRGSSILYLHTLVVTSVYVGTYPTGTWEPFFVYNWSAVWTTGTAYDIVNEQGSLLNGVSETKIGEPWEFFAGLQGQGPVSYGAAYWNAFVTYVSCWSTFGISIPFGTLNLLIAEKQKHVREDCVLEDIMGEDEYVSISDIRKAAKAYDTYDANFPDRTVADPLFDAAGDVQDPRKWVSIGDIRRIASQYQKQLTPNGIIQT